MPSENVSFHTTTTTRLHPIKKTIQNIMTPRRLATLILLLATGSTTTHAFSTVSSSRTTQGLNSQISFPPQSTTLRTNSFSSPLESKTHTSTSLNALPVAGAAIAGAVTGGFFAGGLHAIAGTFDFRLLAIVPLHLHSPCSPLTWKTTDRQPPRRTVTCHPVEVFPRNRER